MYFVGDKSFEEMSDAMNFCRAGSFGSVVTNEDGIILMKHEEVPIEDIFGMIIAKEFKECLSLFQDS
jgi:hypothetical protein